MRKHVSVLQIPSDHKGPYATLMSSLAHAAAQINSEINQLVPRASSKSLVGFSSVLHLKLGSEMVPCWMFPEFVEKVIPFNGHI